MTEIKVLRVPDERLPMRGTRILYVDDTHRCAGDGDFVLLEDGLPSVVIPIWFKPALLAALLEDSGAVKCVGTYCPDCGISEIDDNGSCMRCDATPVGGEVWLLPVPEDTL